MNGLGGGVADLGTQHEPHSGDWWQVGVGADLEAGSVEGGSWVEADVSVPPSTAKFDCVVY